MSDQEKEKLYQVGRDFLSGKISEEDLINLIKGGGEHVELEKDWDEIVGLFFMGQNEMGLFEDNVRKWIERARSHVKSS